MILTNVSLPFDTLVTRSQIHPSSIQEMTYSLMLSALAFVIGLLIGGPLIRLLQKLQIGKRIRSDGPSSHQAKAGTPTMGGIMIAFAVFVVTASFNLLGHWSMLLPLAVIASCGTLGAVDDYLNVSRPSAKGMAASFKFGWLVVIAVVAAFSLHFVLDLTSIYVPFIGKVNIGNWYLPIAAFAIVAMANAVNLSDGLDTLAGGSSVVAFAAYGIIAFLQGQDYVVALSFTVVGAILAFLWFNAHPARLFMGDTGSLMLGALLAVTAFLTGQWLLLPVVGGVFVVETLSVMLQVLFFKLTRGKRLLKMAPLHHHFELLGWSETQVTMRFYLVGIVCAMAGIALALS
ncbi:MAG: phospho-N-acetylmuramoyl-pentapeptide-transferase [Chloroflexi bacterium]|nr:phospho-N-acetylmuramoyl-pentapeptide-transferase [Chloroflexota bacterium]